MAAEREHETQAVPSAAPAAVAATVAAIAPIGNRSTGALLARRPGRGVAHPRLALVIARRQLARAPTREEMIAAFDRELAAATDGTGTWKDVALRLNGFDKADIARMCAKMTLPQLQSTRAAVERELEGWPVAHLLAGLDGAAAQKGRGLRPQSKSIWEAYKQVGYNRWSGELVKNMVWEHVGGSVGSGFAGENTCATRVSWGSTTAAGRSAARVRLELSQRSEGDLQGQGGRRQALHRQRAVHGGVPRAEVGQARRAAQDERRGEGVRDDAGCRRGRDLRRAAPLRADHAGLRTTPTRRPTPT